MNFYDFLFPLAILAALVPVILALMGRDDYSDDEGMSVGDWKRIWAKLTGKAGER